MIRFYFDYKRSAVICYDGESVSPCGNVTTVGPIVQPSDDTWVNRKQVWNDKDREKHKKSKKTPSRFHLSTTNSICTALGANPGILSEKTATTAFSCHGNRICSHHLNNYKLSKDDLKPRNFLTSCDDPMRRNGHGCETGTPCYSLGLHVSLIRTTLRFQ